MLKIENLRLPPGADRAALSLAAAKALRVPPEAVKELTILRRSVDAREDPVLIYTVAVSLDGEGAVLRRCRNRRVSRYAPEQAYRLPPSRPVNPTTFIPLALATLAAFNTFLELPDVVSAISTSPFLP